MRVILIGLLTLVLGACATTKPAEKRIPAQSTPPATQWIRDINYVTPVSTLDKKFLGEFNHLYECSGVEAASAQDLPTMRFFAKNDSAAFVKYIDFLSQPADRLLKINLTAAGKVEIVGDMAGNRPGGGVQIKCFLLKDL